MEPIKCKCGIEFQDQDIEYFNNTNEEGEDYGVVQAYCPHCRETTEKSQWGEIESKQEALDLLADSNG